MSSAERLAGRVRLAMAIAMWLPCIMLAQAPPPNAAATVAIAGSQIRLTYEGRVIFDGTLSGADSATSFQTLIDSSGARITQVLKWTSFSRSRLSLRGRVHAGNESFPAQADRPEDGLAVVRHSVGLSHSHLNRAVYERT